MTYVINIQVSDTENFQKVIKEMCDDVGVVTHLTLPSPDAENIDVTELAVKLYILYEKMENVLANFKSNNLLIDGKLPNPTKIRDLILSAIPSDNLDQATINLSQKMFNSLNGNNNYLPTFMLKPEKTRYLKNYKKLGYKTIDEFVQAALRTQYMLDVAKMLDDRSVDEFF